MSMNIAQICAIFATAFAGAIISYVPAARQNSWPIGLVFQRGILPLAVYLGVIALMLGAGVAWAWHGKTSWWWLLWLAIASFVGAAFITSIFKAWSGAVSIVVAPILAILAVMLPFAL